MRTGSMGGRFPESDVLNHIPVWYNCQASFLEVLVHPLVVPDASVPVRSSVEVAFPEILNGSSREKILQSSFRQKTLVVLHLEIETVPGASPACPTPAVEYSGKVIGGGPALSPKLTIETADLRDPWFVPVPGQERCAKREKGVCGENVVLEDNSLIDVFEKPGNCLCWSHSAAEVPLPNQVLDVAFQEIPLRTASNALEQSIRVHGASVTRSIGGNEKSAGAARLMVSRTFRVVSGRLKMMRSTGAVGEPGKVMTLELFDSCKRFVKQIFPVHKGSQHAFGM